MINFAAHLADVAWPFALLLAWLAGEIGHRWRSLPRISMYALVGFCLAFFLGGMLSKTPANNLLLLANIAFCLILFEAGHRINLHWLRVNPWIGITSLFEVLLTFAGVYIVVCAFSLTPPTSFLLAALAIATSPATIMRVINEQRSSGQVTERALNLSVMNCVLAVLAFKIILGLMVLKSSGDFPLALYASAIVLFFSIILGATFGLFMPELLKIIHRTGQDSTLAFAMTIIVLVTLTHSLKLSPILATLTFGLVTRHRRIVLNSSQRGFGALGDLLSIFLFVFIATTLEWKKVGASLGIGFALLLVRYLAKVIGISLFARLSGITWRKGLLISLAMTPISAFAILVLEQTCHTGINLIEKMAPLAGAALIMEILGPILVQRALYLAKEVSKNKEN